MSNRNNRQQQQQRPAIRDAVKTLVSYLHVTEKNVAKGYDPQTSPVMIEGYGRQTVLAVDVEIAPGKTETCKWIGLNGGRIEFAAGMKEGFEPFTFQRYAELRGYTDAEIASVVRTRTGQRQDGSEWRQSFLVGHLPELANKGKAPATVPVASRSTAVQGL